MNEEMQKDKTKLLKLIKIIAMLVIAFLVLTVIAKAEGLRYIGSGTEATNTITVSGHGVVNKAPDTAKISFTVSQESKQVADGQKTVSAKIDAITKALKDLGIDSADIKTDSYNSYPQYDYPVTPPCYSGSICPRTSTTPILRGYQVTHSITVSVKDLDKVPDVLKVLGDNNVTDLSGPNFGFEDDKAVSREARDMAITDAQSEAKKLANALDVHLVRIVSFSENGNGYPTPMYAQKEMAMDSVAASVAPTIPTGNQKITSDVTVVYEIR